MQVAIFSEFEDYQKLNEQETRDTAEAPEEAGT